MAYENYEQSVEAGQPVELYELKLLSETWHMTSADRPITANTFVWEPTEIQRSNIAVSPDERNEVVEITLPSSHAFPLKYVTIVPGQKATLTIYRLHNTDVLDQQTTIIYKGVVRSIAFSMDNTGAKLAVMPLTAALSRQIPRHTYQGLCNHVLYDSGCKLNEATYRHQGEVTTTDAERKVITVDGLSVKGDGWAVGGFISVGALDFRLIVGHTGNNVTILTPFPADLSLVGVTVSVQAGCDHTIATCSSKFNNVANYGGFAFVPKRDIFRTGIK